VASNSTFFESPQAAAVYKHRLLRSYVPAWAGKVGSRAPGKKVFIYDAEPACPVKFEEIP
jgi:hypothetical protein